MGPRRFPRRKWPAIAVALSLLATAGALTAPRALADVGVTAVDPQIARAGETAQLEVACGGCPPRGIRFPISLVPIERIPKPELCGDNVVCTPVAGKPPKALPFRYLGRTGYDSALRFEVPQVPPGRYAFVVYCESCHRGAGGSMIAGDERSEIIEISDPAQGGVVVPDPRAATLIPITLLREFLLGVLAVLPW